MSDVKDQPSPRQGEGDMWLKVITDMHDRREVGIERYGTPLQAYNGRVSIVDAYQEILDLAVYIRQHIAEEGSIEDLITERDMADAYYKALEAHLRGAHGCEHDFAQVANDGH